MKVDMVNIYDKWAVYPRASFANGDYEGDALFASESEGDCWDWCEERHHEHRRRKYAALVPDRFIRDLEQRCDKKQARIRDLGCEVESNITYRASAAWKESPVHYCYTGDMGACATIKRDETKETELTWEAANFHLREIIGIAVGIWELGFTLTFDKDGKHTIYGNHPQWVTLDEDD